ncbi:MAG: YbaB/EbfC family nucleoid-associated protein [Anaerolineae bacterium]|nr:YbaB/EbfC family nucleoid-associated protein [Anaerolineae bacterium]
MAKARRPKNRSSFAPASSQKQKLNVGGLQQQMAQFQEQMARTQETLGEETVSASSGGGVVTVVANGNQVIESLKIDPEVVDPEDVEMLQDLVLAAVNEALEKAKALTEEKMGALTGGLNIPGLT